MSLTSGTCPWRSSSSTSSSAMKIGLGHVDRCCAKQNCHLSKGMAAIDRTSQNCHRTTTRARLHLSKGGCHTSADAPRSCHTSGLRSAGFACAANSCRTSGLRSAGFACAAFLPYLWPTLCQCSRNRLRCSRSCHSRSHLPSLRGSFAMDTGGGRPPCHPLHL